jgi:hypothetical protein
VPRQKVSVKQLDRQQPFFVRRRSEKGEGGLLGVEALAVVDSAVVMLMADEVV